MQSLAGGEMGRCRCHERTRGILRCERENNATYGSLYTELASYVRFARGENFADDHLTDKRCEKHQAERHY